MFEAKRGRKLADILHACTFERMFEGILVSVIHPRNSNEVSENRSYFESFHQRERVVDPLPTQIILRLAAPLDNISQTLASK